jgi:hypothetical protein
MIKLLFYGKDELLKGIDPDTLEGRLQLKTIKRGVRRETVLKWLSQGRCSSDLPGWRVKLDQNVFGFILVNSDGDALVPEWEVE